MSTGGGFVVDAVVVVIVFVTIIVFIVGVALNCAGMLIAPNFFMKGANVLHSRLDV